MRKRKYTMRHVIAQRRVLSTNLPLLCPSRKRSHDGAPSLLSDYYLVSQSNFCESSS